MADSIGDIQVTISGDYGPLSDDLKTAEQVANAAGQNIADGLSQGAAGADTLTSSIAQVASQIGLTEQQITSFTSILQGMMSAGDSASEALGKIAESTGTIPAPLISAAQAMQQLQIATSGAVSETDTAAEAFTRVGDAAGEASGKVTDLGATSSESAGGAHEAAGGFGEMAEKLVAFGEALAVTEALKAFGEEALSAYSKVQEFTASITALTGSGEAAKSMLEDIEGIAATQPFSFPDLASAAQKLAAFGVEAEKIPEILTLAGDASRATGNSFDAVSGALARIEITGQVTARQLVQLGVSWQDLATTMGVSVSQAEALLKKGGQDAAADLEAVLATVQAKFGQFAEVPLSIGQQFTVLENQIHSVFVGIGEGLAPVVANIVSGFTPAIDIVKSLIDEFNQLPAPVKDTAAVLGVAVVASVALATAAGGLGLAITGVQVGVSTLSGMLGSEAVAEGEDAAATIANAGAHTALAAAEEASAAGAGTAAAANASLGAQTILTTTAEGGLATAIETTAVGLTSAETAAAGFAGALGVASLATITFAGAIGTTFSNLDDLKKKWSDIIAEMQKKTILDAIAAGATEQELVAMGFSIDQVRGAVGNLGTVIDKTQASYNAYDNKVHSLKDTMDTSKVSYDDYGIKVTNLSDLMQNAKQSFDDFGIKVTNAKDVMDTSYDSLLRMASASETVYEKTNNARKAWEDAKIALDAIKAASDGTKGSLDAIAAAAANADEKWKAYQATLGNHVKISADAILSAQQLLSKETDLQQGVAKAQQAFDDLTKMEAAGKPVAEALAAAHDQLTKAIKAAHGETTDYLTSLDSFIQKHQNAAAAAQDAYTRVKDLAGALNEGRIPQDLYNAAVADAAAKLKAAKLSVDDLQPSLADQSSTVEVLTGHLTDVDKSTLHYGTSVTVTKTNLDTLTASLSDNAIAADGTANAAKDVATAMDKASAATTGFVDASSSLQAQLNAGMIVLSGHAGQMSALAKQYISDATAEVNQIGALRTAVQQLQETQDGSRAKTIALKTAEDDLRHALDDVQHSMAGTVTMAQALISNFGDAKTAVEMMTQALADQEKQYLSNANAASIMQGSMLQGLSNQKLGSVGLNFSGTPAQIMAQRDLILSGSPGQAIPQGSPGYRAEQQIVDTAALTAAGNAGGGFSGTGKFGPQPTTAPAAAAVPTITPDIAAMNAYIAAQQSAENTVKNLTLVVQDLTAKQDGSATMARALAAAQGDLAKAQQALGISTATQVSLAQQYIDKQTAAQDRVTQLTAAVADLTAKQDGSTTMAMALAAAEKDLATATAAVTPAVQAMHTSLGDFATSSDYVAKAIADSAQKQSDAHDKVVFYAAAVDELTAKQDGSKQMADALAVATGDLNIATAEWKNTLTDLTTEEGRQNDAIQTATDIINKHVASQQQAADAVQKWTTVVDMLTQAQDGSKAMADALAEATGQLNQAEAAAGLATTNLANSMDPLTSATDYVTKTIQDLTAAQTTHEQRVKMLTDAVNILTNEQDGSKVMADALAKAQHDLAVELGNTTNATVAQTGATTASTDATIAQTNATTAATTATMSFDQQVQASTESYLGASNAQQQHIAVLQQVVLGIKAMIDAGDTSTATAKAYEQAQKDLDAAMKSASITTQNFTNSLVPLTKLNTVAPQDNFPKIQYSTPSTTTTTTTTPTTTTPAAPVAAPAPPLQYFGPSGKIDVSQLSSIFGTPGSTNIPTDMGSTQASLSNAQTTADAALIAQHIAAISQSVSSEQSTIADLTEQAKSASDHFAQDLSTANAAVTADQAAIVDLRAKAADANTRASQAIQDATNILASDQQKLSILNTSSATTQATLQAQIQADQATMARIQARAAAASSATGPEADFNNQVFAQEMADMKAKILQEQGNLALMKASSPETKLNAADQTLFDQAAIEVLKAKQTDISSQWAAKITDATSVLTNQQAQVTAIQAKSADIAAQAAKAIADATTLLHNDQTLLSQLQSQSSVSAHAATISTATSTAVIAQPITSAHPATTQTPVMQTTLPTPTGLPPDITLLQSAIKLATQDQLASLPDDIAKVIIEATSVMTNAPQATIDKVLSDIQAAGGALKVSAALQPPTITSPSLPSAPTAMATAAAPTQVGSGQSAGTSIYMYNTVSNQSLADSLVSSVQNLGTSTGKV